MLQDKLRLQSTLATLLSMAALLSAVTALIALLALPRHVRAAEEKEDGNAAMGMTVTMAIDGAALNAPTARGTRARALFLMDSSLEPH